MSNTINSYNGTTTDNRVDNSVDNSINTWNVTNHYAAPLNKLQDEIIAWLSATNFGAQHIDMYERRQAGTGEWFLNSPEFQNWHTGKVNEKILFCHGIPGAGKSILASIAIQHLREKYQDDKRVAIAFVYCNYNEQHQQNATNLLKSLLCQLFTTTTPKIKDAMTKLYDNHKQNKVQPLRADVSQTLRTVAKEFSQVFIIVDAIDEIADRERAVFISEIIEQVKDIDCIRILITSRSIGHIQAHFEGGYATQLEVRAKDDDIAAYIKGQFDIQHDLRELISPGVVKSDVVAEITKSILQTSQGMFLLARLHLNTVAATTSIQEARAVLQHLPTEINGTYAEVVKRIEGQAPRIIEVAKTVLTWVGYALRPLRPEELQHILAINDNDIPPKLHKDSLVTVGKLVSACAGIVVWDRQGGIVRLVHYTAQDFIQGQGAEFIYSNPHFHIASSCIAYLTHVHSLEQAGNEFFNYAASSWGIHASEESKQPPVLREKIIQYLIETEPKGDVVKYAVVRDKIPLSYSFRMQIDAPSLVLAARFGFNTAATRVLQHFDLEKTLSTLPAPLDAALIWEHWHTVQLLLEKGTFISTASKEAITWVTKNGHTNLLGPIFTNNLNLRWAYEALCSAARYGQEDMVLKLLQGGAGGKQMRSEYHLPIDTTPLTEAASAGHLGIVRLLLKYGAATKFSNRRPTNPLYAILKRIRELDETSELDDKIILELLLKEALHQCRARHKPSPLIFLRTAFGYAAKFGHADLVQMLLDKDAIAISGSCRLNSLAEAALGGHEQVVRIILDARGTMERITCASALKDPLKDPLKDLLCAAAHGGHVGTVQLLLSKREHYHMDLSKALVVASAEGHKAVVELLMREGANANAAFPKYEGRALSIITPLSAARNCDRPGDREDCVQLLLAGGAQDDSDTARAMKIVISSEKPGSHCNANCYQLLRCKLSTKCKVHVGLTEDGVELLELAETWGVNTYFSYLAPWPSHKYRQRGTYAISITALHLAVQRGALDTVRRLIEKGAHMNAQASDDLRTPLHLAAKFGHESVVQLLVGKGAAIDPRTSDKSRTPLHLAAKYGHEGIVQLLADNGADINACDWHMMMALHMAVFHRWESIVRLLVRYGASINARCVVPLSKAVFPCSRTQTQTPVCFGTSVALLV